MVLDQRRIDERRDGCLVSFDVGATKLFAIEVRRQLYELFSQVCLTHGMDWTPNKLSNMNILNVFFAKLADIMSQNMVRSEGRISF